MTLPTPVIVRPNPRDKETTLFRQYIREQEKFGEINDCAVRAIAMATGEEYAKVWASFRDHGRQPRRGSSVNQMRRVITDLGWHRDEIPGDEFRSRGILTYISLAGNLKKLRARGRYVLCTNDHAFAVVNRQVHDFGTFLGQRKRIVMVWRVFKTGKRGSGFAEGA